MYETFENLMRKNKVTASDVSRGTGIPRSMFTDWKKGRSTPKADKMKKIADYFGVDISYFYSEVQTSGQLPYYIDDEAKEIAQELIDNPELRALMDAARKKDKDTLVTVTNLLYLMKGTNPDG